MNASFSGLENNLAPGLTSSKFPYGYHGYSHYRKSTDTPKTLRHKGIKFSFDDL